jgi:DNA-directed RNA polymerase subunit RPC12/RpoP
MVNEMRDRLAELIKQARQRTKNANCDIERNMLFADHLIENGVVVRKQAKWIYSTDCYRCSVCAGKRFNLLLGTDAEYCPYCGAKMIFEKEGADNG